jgi:hypothetical protein
MGEVKIVQPHFYDWYYTPSTLRSFFENHILMTYILKETTLREIITLRGTLQRLYTENSKQIFPELNCAASVPSFIHVSVSDLYIPTINLHILLQEIRWTNRRNI